MKKLFSALLFTAAMLSIGPVCHSSPIPEKSPIVLEAQIQPGFEVTALDTFEIAAPYHALDTMEMVSPEVFTLTNVDPFVRVATHKTGKRNWAYWHPLRYEYGLDREGRFCLNLLENSHIGRPKGFTSKYFDPIA